MNDPKDIIGIVRELCREDSDMTAEEYYNSIYIHFPAIANALIIAIDALELAEGRIEPKEKWVLPNPMETPVSEALTRIRSLR